MIRSLPRSTAGLAALVSGLFAIATAVIGLLVYDVTHEALETQLDHRIELEARALLAEPDAATEPRLVAAIARREAVRDRGGLDYLLVDREGRRLAGRLSAAVPDAAGYVELMPHGDGRVAQSLTTVLPGGGKLVIAIDRGTVDALDRTVWHVFGAGLSAMLLLGAGGAWTIGAITRARLHRIDETAAAIADGDLARRIPRDGSNIEFDRVAGTLNRMLDRNAALMDNLRQVSSDVAHDLRTPLTRLRNRLEEAQHLVPGGAARETLAAAAGQADELLEIFSALLRISEIEGLGVRAHFQPLPLDRLVSDLLETFAPDAEASGHRIVARIDPGVMIDGDRRLLQQLLSNLLDNALRHTPAGTTVSVTLGRRAEAVVLEVADDGAGVPEADRARVFQRFARSERSRSSSGHGLGLALVAVIAQAHRGGAALVPGPGFGVRVTMRPGGAA